MTAANEDRPPDSAGSAGADGAAGAGGASGTAGAGGAAGASSAGSAAGESGAAGAVGAGGTAGASSAGSAGGAAGESGAAGAVGAGGTAGASSAGSAGGAAGASGAAGAGEMRGGADSLGSTEIHPSVLRKVVAHAIRLVPGAEPSAAVRLDASGGDVALAVKLALRYPSPVRATAADVRRSVTEEVERITGYRVRSVAVMVSALRPDPRPRVE
ncbi:hypothetical protein [Saccharothrix sp. HUAS TT1]|uniref:hypothetical protein n=1 Tax=unclassified Saccharothrix TaxID=2593673 RepID=UPI00345B8301